MLADCGIGGRPPTSAVRHQSVNIRGQCIQVLSTKKYNPVPTPRPRERVHQQSEHEVTETCGLQSQRRSGSLQSSKTLEVFAEMWDGKRGRPNQLKPINKQADQSDNAECDFWRGVPASECHFCLCHHYRYGTLGLTCYYVRYMLYKVHCVQLLPF